MTTPAQLESIRAEWLAAPKKARPGQAGRTAVLERWAESLGCSPSTLYRQLNQLGHRGPKRARAAALADATNTTERAKRYRQVREWAQTLMDLMARSPEGSIPLHLCLRAAQQPNPDTGEVLLPPSAADVPLATYQRIITRELAGRQRHRRNRRMHADEANQAWQFDATTSKYLTVDRETDDGDYLLRLWRNPMPAGGYKNKPLGPDRLRLIYYGVWDMHTGGPRSVPAVARGEAGLDAMAALVDLMGNSGDPRIPLHGVPADLWSDQGPIVKHAATRDLIERLGVNVITGEAYRKERMGGVEQTWRRLWQSFEQSLFLVAPAKGRYTLTLSELQARLTEYLAAAWQRPSRRDPTMSRADAWTRSINQQGGARQLPSRPLETIAREVRRWVDGAGIIRWDNVEYEVPQLHRVWVIARRALDGSNRVVVEDPATGDRYDVTPYQPTAYGEELRVRTLPIEQARERAADQPAAGDPYAAPVAAASSRDASAASAPNVIAGRFGPRAQPAADLPDPLEADRYPSLTQAMAALYDQLGAPLDFELRDLAAERILREDLRIGAVRDLAQALGAVQRGAN